MESIKSPSGKYKIVAKPNGNVNHKGKELFDCKLVEISTGRIIETVKNRKNNEIPMFTTYDKMEAICFFGKYSICYIICSTGAPIFESTIIEEPPKNINGKRVYYGSYGSCNCKCQCRSKN
ncbi:MAG: hypothetical protein Satyrvirus17_2 [Satyrvirus sp.]|uniref:Uncharacterized protein n=1 Tax=Satyrvirus sp. TaxID=2487771 RepID=A0A3G5AE25_9VIRU|nr:MAG: hypothetical protein Satyrvirus17_2 [Satyrvirus sp.]